MNDEIETGNPEVLACDITLASSHFCAAALKTYLAAHPSHTDTFGQFMPGFGVRVSGILTNNPRVSLINTVNGREVELLHVVVSNTSQPGALLN